VLQAFANVRSWSRGDKRAPHKAFLLLLALSQLQRGGARWLRFSDFEEEFSALMDAFGPPQSGRGLHYPFWRLQNDGIWEIPEAPPRRTASPSARTITWRSIVEHFRWTIR
jgi:putative restriction endonuclease